MPYELARDMARRVPMTLWPSVQRDIIRPRFTQALNGTKADNGSSRSLHVLGTPCLSGRIARASDRIHFGRGGA